MLDWQTISVALIIVAASIYVLRRALRQLRALRGNAGADASSCASGCGGCGGNQSMGQSVSKSVEGNGTGARAQAPVQISRKRTSDAPKGLHPQRLSKS